MQKAGLTRLTGASTNFTGQINVNGGSLLVDGSTGTGAVTVASGGTFGGSGSAGAVTVQNGGILSPGGTAVGTLTLGSLALSSGSILNYDLGPAGTAGGASNDLIQVTGNLVLDGTVNVTDVGSFGAGLYRLMNYGGTLTDNGLSIGTVPTGFTASDLSINAGGGEVNLVNSAGLTLSFWDGDAAGNFQNNAIDGGNGTWTATSQNWTNITGATNGTLQSPPGLAVFRGAPGTVTVDNSAGAVSVNAVQFYVSGYKVQGGAITLSDPATLLRVGDGTAASSAMTATISASLTGSGGIEKTDLGTLVLAGGNSYSGTTLISTGVLETQGGGAIADSGAVTIANTAGATLRITGSERIGSLSGGGAVGGTVAIANGQTLTTGDASNTTFAGVISGAGGLAKQGSGTFTLGAANTYTGATTVQTGSLKAGVASAFSSASAFTVNGTLDMGGTNQTVAALAGSGTVTTTGSGTNRLTVNGSGNGTFSGSIVNGATGSLALTKTGSGTLTLSGTNSYTGITSVTGGTLAVNGSLASTVTVQNSGTVLAGTGTISGNVSLQSNGAIAPGGVGTVGSITLGGLNMASTARLNMDLGTPGSAGASDNIRVTGDLTLDGTLNITNAGGFGTGLYRLITFGGALIDNTLIIGSTGGANASDLVIHAYEDPSVGGGTVNLINSAGLTLNFWDGGDPGKWDNGVVNGGSGTWTATSSTWTDMTGALNNSMRPQPGFAIFQGSAGTVTVAGGFSGPPFFDFVPVSISGVQFAVDGYRIAGDMLYFSGAETLFRVGDGSALGAGYTATIDATLAGPGRLVKTDLGTLVLRQANTYSGGTTLRGGTLRVENNVALGSGGLKAEGGTLSYADGISLGTAITLDADLSLHQGGTTATQTGAISGSFGLTKTGSGTLTLAGANSYAGTTTVASGKLVLSGGSAISDTGAVAVNLGAVLQLGASETVGSLSGAGDVALAGGSLAAGGNGLSTPFSGQITGTGGLTKQGAGTLTLSGTNTYSGATTVSAGTLRVNGSLASATTVGNGGTLAGSGTIGAAVSVTDGGILSGAQGATLTMNSLGLSSGAFINAAFGAAGSVPLFNVTGNLTLDGTLNVTDAGGLGPGIYRLFNYGGTLTNNGLLIGSTPAGVAASDFTIQTSVSSQVNIVSTAAAELLFWDGGNAALYNNNAIDGGSGTWRADGSTWTDSTGAVNGVMKPQPGFAVFQGTAGTVTTDASGGPLAVTGMQFASDNYVVQGDSITLAGPAGSTTIRVGDGSAGGAAFTTTIGAGLTGASALVKTDLGRLVLTGANSYSGGTTISGGTLQIGNGGTSGSVAGDIVDNAALAFNRSDAVTYDSIISGTGSLTKLGAGTLTLTGANSYSGGTTVSAGVLQIGNGGTTGSVAGNILDNAALAFNRSDALTYDSIISGTGSLTKLGAGTLTLTGANSYSGGTTVSAGVLQIGNGGTTGSITGDVVDNAALAFNRSDAVTFGGAISGTGSLTKFGTGALTLTGDSAYSGGTTISAGMLQVGNGGTTGSVTGDIVDNAALVFNRSNALTFAGAVSGTGSLTKLGAGTLTLTGANSYSGGTTISAGTLQIGNGGTTGSVAGNILDNAALAFNRSDALTYAGIISGTGSLTKLGAGTLTLIGANNYSGGTTISAGTLQIGNGGTTGSVTGNILDNATLAFNRSDAVTYAGTISGTGSLIKLGSGTLTLSGANSYSGATIVSAGTLRVNGSLVSNMIVGNGAALAGSGSVGTVSVADGGLLVGVQGSTLTMASLGLAPVSAVSALLGAAGSVPLFNVTGNLILDGTLNIGDAGGFGAGVYRLFNYGGTLTDNGLAIGATPAGVAASDLSVQTSVAGRVNLISAAGAQLLFWDGGNATLYNNNAVDGGSGTWRADGGTWTDANGTVDGVMKPQPGFAVFQGTAGTVTTDASSGPLAVTGMQFASNNYVVQGDPIMLAGPAGATTIRVGDGSSAGGFFTATIGAALTGASTLVKTDLGRLVLTGANSYSGGTTVSAGLLQIGNGGTTGSVTGDILDNAALAFNRSDAVTFGGTISGTGTLTKLGAGTLTLTGANIYSGGTTVSAGTLQIGAGGTTGSVTGDIVDNAALAFNRSDAVTFGGTISGTGTLTKLGAGTLTLTGANSYSGGTTISAGTLQIGAGGTAGSIAGNIVDNAALAFNRSDAVTFGGTISGTGGLTKLAANTLTLTGANTYSGGTTISAGTLQIGNGGTTGSITGDIVDNAALAFNRSDAVTFGGSISGTGMLTKLGAGTLTLSGNSSAYAGAAVVNAGTLRVDGTLGSAASSLALSSGATLAGSGSIGGAVSVANGGILTGVQGATLTMGSLNLSSGAIVNAALATAGSVPLFNVTGSLVLDGTLNVADVGGFGAGVYRLFNYGGTLTDNGLQIGTTPSAVAAADLSVQTSVAGRVNLISTSGASLSFWDGGNAALYNNNAVDGGTGTWRADGPTWTDSSGAVNGVMKPQPGFAVFQGAAGTVTADSAAGPLTVTGMQFASNGYVVQGDSIALAGAPSTIRVGDGSTADSGFTATIGAALTGTSGLVKTDLGRLILTGTNSYSGGTTIAAGTLQIGNGGTTGSVTGDIADNAALVFNRSDAVTFGGAISGTGTLTKLGAGTLTLTGANSYSGGTTISAGTLQVGNGGTTGSITGNVVNNAALAFNRSDAVTFGGAISGTGTLTKLGAGTLTLTGANSYSGGTTISAGTLQVGNGGTAGSIAGNIVNNAALAFNRSDALSYAGVISGTGSLAKLGAGTLTLSGNSSTYAGATSVSAGTLRVDGMLGSAASSLSLASGATLSGAGSIGGAVSIADGGILSGVQGATLTMGSLNLSSNSIVDVRLASSGNTAPLFTIGGNLVLDGALNVADAGGLGAGIYRLFGYGGSLTDNGLGFGVLPTGYSANDLTVQTSVAGQVNLVNSKGLTLAFWDGGTAANANNNVVNGGSGTWSLTGKTWTGTTGAINGPMQPVPGFAIFGGTAGTVTVSGSDIAATGMQFTTNGYQIVGDPLRLAGTSAVIRVGDGTAAGAAFTATIGSALSGSATLVKTDFGTLVLTGANSYSGGTAVEAGTLIGNAGSIRGSIANQATVVFDQAANAAFAGAVSGNGQMVKSGAGTLALAGANSAGWRIDQGGLVSTTQLFTGNLAIGAGASFTFDQSAAGQYGGTITGQGNLLLSGGGTVTLTGNTQGYAGKTTVNAGTLTVNGLLGGTLEVLQGGRLQGTGMVGSTLLAGRIAPGNSIGTINVNGNFTFASTGVFEVEVNPQGQSDRIAVTGTATLQGGSVMTLASGGTYSPITDYTILTAAGGVTGKFGGVTSNLAFLDPYLSYGTNAVTLRLVRNDISFGAAAQTPNQAAVAPAIEALGYGNALYNAVLVLSASDARLAYDQLSGEGHATVRGALVEDSRLVRDAFLGRGRQTVDGIGVWGTAFGSWDKRDGTATTTGFDRSSQGFVTGFEAGLGGRWQVGLGVGYSSGDLDSRSGFAASSKAYHAGVYAAGHYGALTVSLGAAQSWHDVKTDRSVAFPGFTDALKSSYDLSTTQVFGEVSGRLGTDSLRIEPFLGLAHVRLSGGRFAELGGAAALSAKDQSQQTTFATLGLRGKSDFGGSGISLDASVGIRRAFGDVTPRLDLGFAGKTPFDIAGTPLQKTTVVLDLGANIALGSSARFRIGYMGQHGSRTQDHGAQATLSLNF